MKDNLALVWIDQWLMVDSGDEDEARHSLSFLFQTWKFFSSLPCFFFLKRTNVTFLTSSTLVTLLCKQVQRYKFPFFN